MKSKKKTKTAYPVAESQSKFLSWDSLANVFCPLMLFSLWFASFFPGKRLWGINHWAYFPLGLRTIVIASACIIFIPKVQRKLTILIKPPRVRVFNYLTENHRFLGYLLISMLSLLIFYLFRTKTHLLGDGFQILDSISAGSLTPNWSQPLAIWIYLNSYHLLKPVFNWDGAAVYALISYIAGIIFVVFALRLANFLGKSPSTRWFIFLILILMGSAELFFGYAEHYSLLFSGILIYLFYSLKFLRGQTKIFVPALIFLILLPLHFSSLNLLPSLLYLLLFQPKEEGISRPFRAKKAGIVLLSVLILLLCLVLYVLKYNWFVFSYLMPVLHGIYTGPNYTLFSPDHIIDFLNQQFLISPVGFALCLIFFIFKPKTLDVKKQTFRFLLIVALSQPLFNFIINPGLGAPRDWDLFAGVGLGYTVLALYLLSHIPSNPRTGYLKLNLVMIAFLFTLPWILINASPDKSVTCFRNLLDLDPKKSRNGHFILASYFDQSGKPEERDREYRKVTEKFPEVELSNQGFSLMQKGDLDQAQKRFIQALQLSPDFAEAHAGLALYYYRTGDLQKSEMELKKTLEVKPDYRSAYADLGDIWMERGNFEKAEKFYSRAVRMGVKIPNVWNNLGTIYAQSGDLAKAISYYLKALAQDKDFAKSHYGLAHIYYRQGKMEESLRETNLLLQIKPNFALGYYQLGLVNEKMGRKKEAANAYRRYLEIQPNDPKAAEVKQLMEGLGAE